MAIVADTRMVASGAANSRSRNKLATSSGAAFNQANRKRPLPVETQYTKFGPGEWTQPFMRRRMSRQ